MNQRFLLAVALFCASKSVLAQTDVAPILQPHQTFVDASGSPCAGCSLATFIAGTTTPQPTYTDSNGISQNTNPIILSTSGGATIWLATSTAYKLVLKSPLGATVWTVDNVRGNQGSTPCGPSYAVQFANSGATNLDCDPLIAVDPFSHSLQVGGSIGSTPHFNLVNLAAIPTTWTFDVTTPTTALNSLGPIGLANLAPQAPDTVLMNATEATAAPTAVALPNCPTGITYDTAVHALGCYTAAIPLTRLATQAADTLVMNASGSSAIPAAVVMPPGCLLGDNYDTTTHTWSCVTASTTLLDYYWTITGCTVGVGQPQRCIGTTTLPINLPDANVQVFCGTNDIVSPITGSTSCGLYNGGTFPTTAGSSFNYAVNQIVQGGSGGSTPQVYFHIHHN